MRCVFRTMSVGLISFYFVHVIFLLRTIVDPSERWVVGDSLFGIVSVIIARTLIILGNLAVWFPRLRREGTIAKHPLIVTLILGYSVVFLVGAVFSHPATEPGFADLYFLMLLGDAPFVLATLLIYGGHAYLARL